MHFQFVVDEFSLCQTQCRFSRVNSLLYSGNENYLETMSNRLLISWTSGPEKRAPAHPSILHIIKKKILAVHKIIKILNIIIEIKLLLLFLIIKIYNSRPTPVLALRFPLATCELLFPALYSKFRIAQIYVQEI